MYGSILFNCWGSLIAFAITFSIMYQVSIFPSKILIVSFAAALTSFVFMFLVRYLIGYILYTPDDGLFEEFVKEAESGKEEETELLSENHNGSRHQSTVDFDYKSPEEIARVVRTMMLEEKDT